MKDKSFLELKSAVSISEINYQRMGELSPLFEKICRSEKFQRIDNFRDQIGYLFEKLKEENIKFPKAKLCLFFDVASGVVSRFLKNYGDIHQGKIFKRGRKSILTMDQQNQLFSEIEKRYREKKGINSYAHLKSYVYDKFNILIDKNTLKSIILRSKKFKIVIGRPMEKARNEVDPNEIQAYFKKASGIVNEISIHLIFNMDEVGFQEWADRKEVKVFVPIEHAGFFQNNL